MRGSAKLAGLVGAIFVAALALGGCSLKQPEAGPFLDPTLAALIPGDTTMIASVHMERLVKTTVYQKYLKDLPIPFAQEFVQRTGIDLNKQLWQVVLVSNGRDSFVLGRGKFADELMAPDFSKPGVKRFIYGGLTLFGDEQRALMLINSSTAAIGETRVLRTLVDQRASITALPARLTSLKKEIPHDAQIWAAFASGGPIPVLPGNLANVTRILKSMDGVTLYFDLTTTVNGAASGMAISDAAAEDVYGALSTLLALAQMGGKGPPVYQGIKVEKEARRITVRVNGDPELLGLLLK